MAPTNLTLISRTHKRSMQIQFYVESDFGFSFLAKCNYWVFEIKRRLMICIHTYILYMYAYMYVCVYCQCQVYGAIWYFCFDFAYRRTLKIGGPQADAHHLFLSSAAQLNAKLCGVCVFFLCLHVCVCVYMCGCKHLLRQLASPATRCCVPSQSKCQALSPVKATD